MVFYKLVLLTLILEFMCAQSPYNMRGLLLSLVTLFVIISGGVQAIFGIYGAVSLVITAVSFTLKLGLFLSHSSVHVLNQSTHGILQASLTHSNTGVYVCTVTLQHEGIITLLSYPPDDYSWWW